MFNFFKKKKEKRSWIPLSLSISGGQAGGGGSVSAGSIPSVRKSLQIYRDLILAAPLICLEGDTRVEDPILEVLKRPCNFLSGAEFWAHLVSDFWLDGNFVAYIQSNESGQVTALLPFPTASTYATAQADRSGQINQNDPFFLNQVPSPIFYLTSYSMGKNPDGSEKKITKRYSAEDIFHLKSPWGSHDFLNGVGISVSYSSAIQTAVDSIDTAAMFGRNRCLPQSLLTSSEAETDEQYGEATDALKDFQADKNLFLTLPFGSELKPLMGRSPEAMLQILSSISSLNIARIFNLPLDVLAGREDGVTGAAGFALKESFRFFVKSAGASWLRMLADRLTEELLPKGRRLKFLTKHLQSSDLRELAMSLNQLRQDGLIDDETVKRWLGDIN